MPPLEDFRERIAYLRRLTQDRPRLQALPILHIDDRSAALRLADATVARWLGDALRLAANVNREFLTLSLAVDDLASILDEQTAREAADVAEEAATSLAPLPNWQRLADMARRAGAVAKAAADGRHGETASDAANVLYERVGALDAGPDYVIQEAGLVLGANGPHQDVAEPTRSLT